MSLKTHEEERCQVEHDCDVVEEDEGAGQEGDRFRTQHSVYDMHLLEAQLSEMGILEYQFPQFSSPVSAK